LQAHYGWAIFHQKRWCITNIIIHNKLKVWWYPLAILNTSKKLKNLHDNILELKVHFESKLILIQQLNEDDWIKLMYIQYIIYNFSMAIRPYVCGSWNITKQENWEKNAMSIYKSPFYIYGNGFSPKKKTSLCIYCSKMKEKHFFEWKFIQKL